MARPSTKPVKLKDGFYIEVRNKGAQSGIKIHRRTKEQIEAAMGKYTGNKEVKFLGEVVNGKLVKQ